MPKTLENTLFFDIIDIEISLSEERAPTIISCWVLFCIYRGLRYMRDDNRTSIGIDLDNIPKDMKAMSKEQRQQVIDAVRSGEIEHKQIKASLNNLVPMSSRPEEEQRAIRRKGWEKMTELKGERKTAKQILDNLLPIFASDSATDNNDSISDDIKKLIKKHNVKLTQYDLIMLAMISRAQNGDVKAASYVSDHFGDVVVKETHNVNESMSQADKELIRNISDRLGIANDIIDID